MTESPKRPLVPSPTTPTQESPLKKTKLQEKSYLLCGTWADQSGVLRGWKYTPSPILGVAVIACLVASDPSTYMGDVVLDLVSVMSTRCAPTKRIRKVFPAFSLEDFNNLGEMVAWDESALEPLIPIYYYFEY